MIKVLVFESDAAFAGELRTELSRLGCAVQVVDDGNAGLAAASAEPPGLILLSIELPRMNGFSVCNKLKKDPALKDVPLIIMSSESSDDTFEQHKKLRTRAEDYVHKPIALGELLEHIRRFVPLGGGESAESEIALDDSIEIFDEADDEGVQVTAPPPPPPPRSMPPPPPPMAGRSVPPPVPQPVVTHAPLDLQVDDDAAMTLPPGAPTAGGPTAKAEAEIDGFLRPSARWRRALRGASPRRGGRASGRGAGVGCDRRTARGA